MIYLTLAVVLVSAVSAQECRPPPYRQGMSVIYGSGFVEFICNTQPDRSFLLRCLNGSWQGYVPDACDPPRPTRPRTPPSASPPTRGLRCGPPPFREDMLHFDAAGGRFVDYYCKPPLGGHYQPFAYRLVCRSGGWRGDLPLKCPEGLEHYPKAE